MTYQRLTLHRTCRPSRSIQVSVSVVVSNVGFAFAASVFAPVCVAGNAGTVSVVVFNVGFAFAVFVFAPAGDSGNAVTVVAGSSCSGTGSNIGLLVDF